MGRKPEKQGKSRGRNPPVEHRWKKGQSGNPGGRPKGSVNLTTKLRKLLAKDDGALADALVQVMVREAAKGKFPFAKEILERVDGKAPQRVEVTASPVDQMSREERIAALERALQHERDALERGE